MMLWLLDASYLKNPLNVDSAIRECLRLHMVIVTNVNGLTNRCAGRGLHYHLCDTGLSHPTYQCSHPQGLIVNVR